jgi:hypothetical protein
MYIYIYPFKRLENFAEYWPVSQAMGHWAVLLAKKEGPSRGPTDNHQGRPLGKPHPALQRMVVRVVEGNPCPQNCTTTTIHCNNNSIKCTRGIILNIFLCEQFISFHEDAQTRSRTFINNINLSC